MCPGIFPICPFLLGLLTAPTTISPKGRDTIWTFPEKKLETPCLETPRFSFSQKVVVSVAGLPGRMTHDSKVKFTKPSGDFVCGHS